MAKRRGRSRSKGEADEETEDADAPQKGSKARSRAGGKRRAERLAAIEAQRRQKRNRLLTIVVVVVAVAIAASAAYIIMTGEEGENGGNPVVVMDTSYGIIEIELFMDQTPETAGNFKDLVEEKFYDGLTFHRIVDSPDFKIIQGGDPNGDGSGGPGYKIDFEDSAGRLKHKRGSIAMARSQEKDSAGSQFYICANDIPDLDGEYAVFGHVVSGMEVVDTINQVATDQNDRPYSPVHIDRIYFKGEEQP